MKCLRIKDGTIKRVPNGIAELAVKTGKYTYCSKKEWKGQNRPSQITTGELAKVGV